jgi:hypothetical protein
LAETLKIAAVSCGVAVEREEASVAEVVWVDVFGVAG